MTRRRDFIIGGACAVSAAAALALKPTRKISLLSKNKKLSDILPARFGDWVSKDVSDFYAPQTQDSLLARLYGETVGKIYSRSGSDTQIMMLMAHGDSQSNELQLHRPEVCYPAFGFAIIESEPIQLTIKEPVRLPGRRLIAEAAQQRQAVVYWTRLGEYFPVGVTEQRLERLDTAFHRYIPDGLLARFSAVGTDTGYSFAIIEAFIPELIMQVAPHQRAVLIGSLRAQQLLEQPTT